MSKFPLVYREKPYVVYSMQYNDDNDYSSLEHWVNSHGGKLYKTEDILILEQDSFVDYIEKGDYIVREMNGNLYSCSEKTFLYRFERVD